MKTSNRRVGSVAIIVSALLGGAACTLGPEPERTVTAADVGDEFVYATQDADLELPEVSPWWRTFGFHGPP